VSKRKPDLIDDLPISGSQKTNTNDPTSPALKPRKPSVSYPDEEGAYADDFDGEDRPIRPKSEQDYNDNDPDNGDEGDFNSSNNREEFPRGQHPLEGVDHFKDLPSPEELTGKSRFE
jgi:hypothetical protein